MAPVENLEIFEVVGHLRQWKTLKFFYFKGRARQTVQKLVKNYTRVLRPHYTVENLIKSRSNLYN